MRFERAEISLAACAGIAAAIFYLDFLLGPAVRFPILFIFPVSFAAWFNGAYWGAAFAALLPAGHYYSLDNARASRESLVELGFEIAALLAFTLVVHFAAAQTRRIRVLQGMLSICMVCKRIRNSTQHWQQLEAYITQNSEAQFSHGLCQECATQHYGLEAAEHRATARSGAPY